ncbi:AAA family ATPase [Methylobacterium sp. C25]|uniref:AAA family ATPase n=1 Tax=Methylobacterium sp. C25 TaxID=2721622 RepID=UPI001F263537|nr:AAA family ATPase [Methylobacterium sp. C25]MCE4225016.1 AAA family ATPase [Methylobacterium sp. C25]
MNARPDTQTKSALAGARLFLKRRKAALAASAGRVAGRLGPVPAAASVVAGATLGRVPGLIDEFLDSGPVVIVVEAVDDDWAAALGRAVRDCVLTNARIPPKAGVDGYIPAKPDSEIGRQARSASPVRVFAGPCRISDKESKDASASIADMCSVVAIARDPGREMPPAVLRAADHRLVAERLDADLLVLVVAAVTSCRPKKMLSAELLPLLDLDDIRLAVHRDRGADGCIDRLEALLRRRICASSTSPRLADLQGYGAAGEWGRSLAEDLKAYLRSEICAADLPRGGVFWGPSGVGKTLLAAAIAAEAGVPLVVGSLGRWQSAGEAHLGTTCKAMRQFFADARSQAPCIAFVDELDSFGDRKTFRDYNRDYSTQIVNAFLECLDGAEQRDGVVLLGATNQPGRIDSAIVRSGRFDRMIEIHMPSKSDLALILRHHLGPDLPDDDLEDVARRCLGGTGADCAALIRRARSRARRAGRRLERADLFMEIGSAVEPFDPETERRIGIHEMGHVLAGHLLGFEIGSVVLQSPDPNRRAFALGRTKGVMTPDRARDLLCVYVAGRAAEILVFGSASAGAAHDLKAATDIAWDIHYRWAFGTRLSVLSPQSIDADPTVIEDEIQRAAARAEEIVSSHRATLDQLADTLIERISLEGCEVVELIARSIDTTSPAATLPPTTLRLGKVEEPRS